MIQLSSKQLSSSAISPRFLKMVNPLKQVYTGQEKLVLGIDIGTTCCESVQSRARTRCRRRRVELAFALAVAQLN